MISLRLLRISVVYLMVGLVVGLIMGTSRNYSLISVHTHILLLGWLTMAVTAFVYLWMPGCANNRLAKLHFWGHYIALPVMMVGLALQAYGQKGAAPMIAAGSTLVVVSLLFFTLNLFLNGRLVDTQHQG
ncbi:MAG: cytochrome-c oxidase [Acidobacteriales bacterium]|nr:MAG: cytochrome-c oxidase [Terriglobales bacterium]